MNKLYKTTNLDKIVLKTKEIYDQLVVFEKKVRLL